MKKNLYKILAFTILGFALLSCSEDDGQDTKVKSYDISDIFGHTFEGSINASSGNSLTPTLTIFNSERVDWNMSKGSMSTNQFYYTAQKTATNVWTLYWYSTKADAESANTEAAGMMVRLGINSLNSISIKATSVDSSVGAGSAMTNTVVELVRTSDIPNTNPTAISTEDDSDEISDLTIAIFGESATWFEDTTTYEGSFNILVGEGGSIAKDHGTSGEGYTPTVVIAKNSDKTVTVSTPKTAYSQSMSVDSFDIEGVAVTESKGIYYLSCEEFESKAGSYTIKGNSLTGKLEDGVLTLRVVFVPGAMPFPITQIFTSSQKVQ